MQSSHWVGDLGFGLSGMRVYRIFPWLFRLKLNCLSLTIRCCFFCFFVVFAIKRGLQPVRFAAIHASTTKYARLTLADGQKAIAQPLHD